MDRIDGVRLDRFEVGYEYDVGTLIGSVLLAERWAEPVDPDPAHVAPFDRVIRNRDGRRPANLIRETYPPYNEGQPALAADRSSRKKRLP